MNLILDCLLIGFKYGVSYIGLRNSHFASEFTCLLPASELAMSINQRHDNAGKTFSITFDILHLKWRNLFPDKKEFTSSNIINNVVVKFVKVN